MSNAVPDVNNAVLGVSNAVPDVGNAVPDVSNAVPDVSNAVPDVSSTGTCRYTCCTCKSRDYFRVMPGAKITMIAHVYPLQ